MNPYSFHIQTFGCQMNANDSDWLCRALASRGYTETPFDDASIYILNTCSIRDKAEQKVYSELGRIASICKAKKRENVMVCVGGCVAQQVGPALGKRFPQVRLLFGTDGVAHAPDAIDRLVTEPNRRLNLLEFVEHFEERHDTWQHGAIPPTVFVNIMQGCNNFCTYCIVPYVRGKQKSRTPDAIIEECQSLLLGGAKEITLLGQNVNSYGQDALAKSISFASLLDKIARLPGLERLRFMTSHPKDIAPEVIESFARHPNICPRLHLPLQSGSDKILQAMNRKYTTDQYLDIVEKLRVACPNIVLSTDIIVGFPGETDKDFEATMRVMEQVHFASSFSFVYSDRPKAKACLFPQKVERHVAMERLSRLQSWQSLATEKILQPMVGKTLSVLLETPARGPVVFPKNADERTNDPAKQLTECQEMTVWHGKTSHGINVTVPLPSAQDYTGYIIPVRIDAVVRHSLKGTKTGSA